MDAFDYIWAGVQAVFLGPSAFELLSIPIPTSLVMVSSGLLLGIVVGATPGLAAPMAMAISLPILISVFGYSNEALLPVLGFLIGLMKGGTLGGAVPAILFNTPGTPDAFMTTLDGYPMTQKGQARKALKVAHISSASGDTFSDIVLFCCAPFLAILVESYLDFPEKTALILLSLSFVAAIVGKSVGKGLLAMGLGMFAAFIGTGEDFYPRLTMGAESIAAGFSIASAILGVLILGEVFTSMEDLWRKRGLPDRNLGFIDQQPASRLKFNDVKSIFPYVRNSAFIGTFVGALPGIGSTLAATLGYASGQRRHEKSKNPEEPNFGNGAIQGVAATEAANSAVSGSNLIPVLARDPG